MLDLRNAPENLRNGLRVQVQPRDLEKAESVCISEVDAGKRRETADERYDKAIENYPRHRREIDELPRIFDEVLALYRYKSWMFDGEKADFFYELVTLCIETQHVGGRDFLARVCESIDAVLREHKMMMRFLYNPYRNLYMDKCYGDSKVPLVEWMDFSKF